MLATQERVSKAAPILAILVCLIFAAYTQHAWEDYLITFRASLNLATGNGLVYQPGERVHSFTSPLGTLLPALFALVGGPEVEIKALWLFRLVSAAANGIALWLVIRLFFRDRLAPWAAAVACGLWVFDAKIVDFSTNGMESALLIFFVVLTWWTLVNGAKIWPIALSFAGLQWTRPDGVVFFGALSLAWLCLGEKSASKPEPKPWLAIFRGAALGMALYLPWVLFAWFYYGSPVPHTILAKQFYHPPMETAIILALYPVRLLGAHVSLHDLFMPAYFYFGGWPQELAWVARLLGTVAGLTWLWPAVKPAGRVASAALFLGGIYLDYIPGSPWYFPGWQVLACIAWAYLLGAAVERASNAGRWKFFLPTLLRTTGLLLVALQVGLLVAVAWQMRIQQTLIENDHRHEIGRWLKGQAARGDRVYLEPLGYIGFYSGLKMLDNPGLAAPEVVAVRRAGQRSHAQIIQALKPEWVVLRPDQIQGINESSSPVLAHEYHIVQIFDTRAKLDAIQFLPGRGYLDFDARFLVYSRNTPNASHDTH